MQDETTPTSEEVAQRLIREWQAKPQTGFQPKGTKRIKLKLNGKEVFMMHVPQNSSIDLATE